MSRKIRAAVVGYGNIGKYVLDALRVASDFEIAGIVRRDAANIPVELKEYNVVNSISQLEKVDVAVLCTPTRSVEKFALECLEMGINTVDSFDTHARIPEHFKNMDRVSKEAGTVSLISSGWDPGLFSLNRLLGQAILPNGMDYTFWGKGVSQGHSDAIRRVEGVKDAKQYTVPIESAIEAVRNGENPTLTPREKHLRECYVVAEEGADRAKIEETIKNMPNYFAEYNTIVHFISEEELEKNHSGIPHGGFVIRSGKTGMNKEHSHIIEYSLKLDSNPEFTANVLLAYARAAFRFHKEGVSGAKSVFDIAPAYLSIKSGEELRKTLL